MTSIFCLLDVDYFLDDNKPVVRLWGKNPEGQLAVFFERGFFPYFYIELKEGEDASAVKKNILSLEVEGYHALKVEEVQKKLLGKEKNLIKITVQIPADVRRFWEILREWKEIKEAYEYTLPFPKRYLIDKQLVPMGWVEMEVKGQNISSLHPIFQDEYPLLDIMAFDIEVLPDTQEIITVSTAETTLTSVFSWGKKTRGVVQTNGEKGLIDSFSHTVRERNPDIIVGYNTDRFDFPILQERALRLGTTLSLGRTLPLPKKSPGVQDLHWERGGRFPAAAIPGRVHVDLFSFVERILSSSLSTDILTLDRVSQELIGKGKKKMEWKEIEDAWRKGNVKKVASYCLADSALTLELAQYLLPQIYELCRVSGETLFDSSRMFYSQLVEWLYIRKAAEFGEIFPNRPGYEEIERRRAVSYMGGYVHTPQEGIHHTIAVFDFASLYPSIIITHNISPETLNCTCCKGGKNAVPERDYHYCEKRRGFITSILKDVVKKRMDVKQRMKTLRADSHHYRILNNRQYALKILANASYGYYAYPASRWYSKICAESITSFGRMYIKKIISLAESLGYPVIYGDTDSLFLRMEPKRVASFITEANNLLPGIVELDYTGFYKAGIFVAGKGGVGAKKRYALLDSKGKLVIRGFERVRRDWSAVAKTTQENVLHSILKENNPKKAVRIVKKIIKDLQEEKIGKNDVTLSVQLTKPLPLYEQIGPHVAVAKKILARGGAVKAGTTIRYIVTKGSGSISERCEPAEEAKNYDPEYYIKNQVLPAALRILSGIGYTEQDFLTEKKSQHSLEKFMRR